MIFSSLKQAHHRIQSPKQVDAILRPKPTRNIDRSSENIIAMRVLIISLFSHMRHHLATELELAQTHLDDGDEVTVLACNGDLPACMGNTKGEARQCRSCITARHIGLRSLTMIPPVHLLGHYYSAADRAREASLQTRFATDAEIRSYVVDGLDIGYAALSSTVWEYRDPHLESEESRALLGRMVVASFRVFRSVKNFLQANPGFDRAYIFNGRFATSRGALRACQQAGVNVFLHERGSTSEKYMVFENSLPHDRQRMLDRINRMWEEANAEERTQGDVFYQERRNRVESLWHSFTKEQQAGKLPDQWDPRARNVVVFTSSEDEFVSIGKEWENPAFETQTQAIVDLHRALAESDSPIELYVRMHPNLRKVDNSDTRRQRSLNGNRLHVIPPDSKICSYALLDGCEKVISFGSTMGIEANYWGKPSILAGISFYGELGGTYAASSAQELYQLTVAHLTPKPNEPARKYGFYTRTFGKPFVHYRAVNFSTGFFRGKFIRPPAPFAPYRLLIPQILNRFGTQTVWRNRLDNIAYFIGYVPFVIAHRAWQSIRKVVRVNR